MPLLINKMLHYALTVDEGQEMHNINNGDDFLKR